MTAWPGRNVQLLWGPGNTNVLAFDYPAAIDMPRFWRGPRAGSEQVFGPGVQDAWVTGRDYRMEFQARWLFDSAWAGPGAVQAFLDWCSAGNSFALVPDAVNAPLFAVPGCLLTDPFDKVDPALEQNGAQNLKVVFRNPTYDLGLAWRGLMFEYAPGADLTAQLGGATFTGGPAGYIDRYGLWRLAPANTVRASHYPGSGLRTAAFEDAATSLLTFPEDLTNGAWSKLGSTIPSTNNTSPRGDPVACFVREDVSTGVHGVQQGITLAGAGDKVGFCLFLKAAGRTAARCRVNNTGGTETTITVTLTGNGVVNASGANNLISTITPLAGGWYMVMAFGTPGGSTTGGSLAVVMINGSESYVGDGASGMYMWGFALTDGQPTGIYWGSAASRPSDILTWPFAYVPQPMFVYASVIEAGSARMGGYPSLMEISDDALPMVKIFSEASNGQLTYGWTYWNTQNNECNPVTSPAQGDKVEVLGILNPDGSTQIRLSINGGADIVNTNVGTQAIAAAWRTQLLRVNGQAVGDMALTRLKVGPLSYLGQSVNTLALARAA